jgi:hypothetical protein
LLRRGKLQERRRVALATPSSPFSGIVLKKAKLVEILLFNGVILVIMTTGATHGESGPDIGCGLNSIHDVFGLILFRYRPTFEIDHVVPIEPSGSFAPVSKWVKISG